MRDNQLSLTTSEQNVLKLVDESKASNVALMQRLIQIRSYTGEEEEIGEFLVREVRKFGLEDVRIVQQSDGRPNVVARYHGRTGKPSMTVYGHYDTVPAGNVTRWTYGPFSGALVGNRIYGRGGSDHKFPISPMLHAIKAIQDAGVTLNGDVVFAFVCDEEFGGHKGTKFLVDEGYCDTDYLLYSGGGSEGKTIGVASNPRAYYRINVRGKTTHTGRNEAGVNAALKAAKLISRLETLGAIVNNRRLKFNAGDVEIEGRGRFSVNYVHASTCGNNVPDNCTIVIDRRLIPVHETFEGAQAEIQSVLDDMKKEDPEFDAEVIWVPDRWMEGVVQDPHSPLVKALQRSAEKVLHFTPTIGKGPTGSSSDNGWYASKYPGRSTASYGVSRGGNSHTYDEYITVDGLIDSTKIYALTMMDLLGIM